MRTKSALSAILAYLVAFSLFPVFFPAQSETAKKHPSADFRPPAGFGKPSLSKAQAYSIIAVKFSQKPDTVIPVRFQNRDYLIARIGRSTLAILSSFAGDWQQVYNCCDDETTVDSLEVTMIGKRPIVYYIRIQAGNAYETESYSVFALQNNDTFHVDYFLDYNSPQKNRPLPIAPELSAQPSILAFLEAKIHNCQYLKGSDKQYDVAAPENANQRWLIDNSKIYDYVKYNDSASLVLTMYKENLRHAINMGGIIDSAESAHFVVWTYFRGCCIGYNKTTSKYFVVWVPSIVYDNFEGLSIDSTETAEFTLDNIHYSVDLHNSLVRVVGDR
jgi:hypothetical protein